MANILLLTLVFPPDSVSTAHIMGELAKDLGHHGHTVTVVTTAPHYNRDEEAESRQPFRNHWGSLLRKSSYSGIDVYHVLMPRKSKSILLRLASWVGFHLVSTIAGMTVIPKPDVILVPSPPLTIGLSAWVVGKFHRAPYIYNVQELYPDIAVSLGALRSRLLIDLLFRLERLVYSKAACLTVIASRMRERVLQKGVPDEKVKVIPNFVDTDDLTPLSKDNAFSREHKIDKKFVVSYAGNIGPAQGLENFVDAAALLQNNTDVHFMMIGNGILWEPLKQRVLQAGLANFTILPYQPYSLIPSIYCASDICLVPQATETGCDAIPSKVYRIMACARPVIAVTDLNSDLAELISSVGCGMSVQAGSPEILADTVLKAYLNQSQWRQMGEIGRTHVAENYSRSKITGRYNKLIKELVAKQIV